MKQINLIESPLISGKQSEHVRDIPVKYIINSYKGYGIDVRRFFDGIDKLSIYKCPTSGYEFFYPNNVTGDSNFYESLQVFDWYYMPWKWEHEIATNYLEDAFSVLEVGCAHGAFLAEISHRFRLSKAIGLELNESTPLQKGIVKIYNKTIQEYAKSNPSEFDVVCSYQVLEHVSDVKSFLSATVECLKLGGKLIISVPNNASFVGMDRSVLNMPPHHVGLWSGESLKYIENIYPLKVIKIIYEPLQYYHIDSYINTMFYSDCSVFISKIKKRFDRLTGRYNRKREKIIMEKDKLFGHTVLAVFEKL